MRALILAAAVLCISACTEPPGRESRVDPQIAAEIAKIKAIDNHAHPVRPISAGEPADTGYDALPVENLEFAPDPVRIRPESPAVREAQRKLKDVNRASAVSVLDALNVDIMLANRVWMGAGLPPDRFRWVAYADALMYPLNNDAMLKDSDKKAFFALEEKLLARYYSECGITSKPATLDEYLNKVVRATLERHKQGGAVAEKFEMAYLRPLDVGNPSKADAEKVYSTGAGDQKPLQDYIFRFIAAECGRLGMAVHIHTSAGAGSYFNVAGANPLNLEPLFNDPSLRKTNFVMLHGGWPYISEITALLQKPNTYLDFSQQSFENYPREAASAIRKWLEFEPEKIMFATDAYPFSKEVGWPEAGYVAAATGREALGIALTGMMHDEEISRDRAIELARMVLRDSARKLYGLP